MRLLAKRCSKCRAEKPMDCFSPDKRASDGKQSQCRQCMNEWRKENGKKIRSSERYKSRMREWLKTEKGKKLKRRQFDKWVRANPQKRQAQSVVNNAIASGQIERAPCVICGAENNVHGHHDNYARPIDVIWLCPTHHHERHRSLLETHA